MAIGGLLRHIGRFGILRWLVGSRLFPLDFAEDGRENVYEPYHASDDSISNFAALGVVRKLEAETTIDDSQGDDDAAKPDVSVRPEAAVPVLLVHLVVNHA